MANGDWAAWFGKIKWYLVSFKFISFCTVITLLVLFWNQLGNTFQITINTVKELKKLDVITKEGASEIIIKTQAVLYDTTFSHAMLAVTAVISAILAIKGVSYVMNSKQAGEVIKKVDNKKVEEDLTRFLPKR
jgi:hypothetical protein